MEMDKLKSKGEASAGSSGETRVRIPLATIQKGERGVCDENEMVGRKSPVKKDSNSGEGGISINSTDKSGRVTKPSGKSKSGNTKRKCVSKGIQTLSSEDLEFIIGDEINPDYWRQLAESKGKALKETLMENEFLHGQIEELEAKNQELEYLIQEAEKITEMIVAADENDDENADESGIGGDGEDVND